jgi:hypothetical protein
MYRSPALLPRLAGLLAAVALLAPLAPARRLAAQPAPAGVPASPPSGPLWDSYRRAAAVVRDALAAHGGEAAVRGLAAAAYRWEGEDYTPSQGRVPSAAWDTAGNARAATEAVRVDLARGRYAWDREFRFGGGYLNAIRVAADGRTLVAHNPEPRRGMGGTTFTRDTTGVAARRALLALQSTMPVLLLREALARASTLRYLGASAGGGGREEAVAFTGPDGEAITLVVDAATHRVVRREEVGVGTLGDEVDAYHFTDYRTVAGLAVPHRLGRALERAAHGRRRLGALRRRARRRRDWGLARRRPRGLHPDHPRGPARGRPRRRRRVLPRAPRRRVPHARRSTRATGCSWSTRPCRPRSARPHSRSSSARSGAARYAGSCSRTTTPTTSAACPRSRRAARRCSWRPGAKRTSDA